MSGERVQAEAQRGDDKGGRSFGEPSRCIRCGTALPQGLDYLLTRNEHTCSCGQHYRLRPSMMLQMLRAWSGAKPATEPSASDVRDHE